MARGIHRLTDVGVKSAARRGRHSDGGGLYLRVSQTGGKSWGFIWNKNGTRREMGLGAYPAVSLAKARKLKWPIGSSASAAGETAIS